MPQAKERKHETRPENASRNLLSTLVFLGVFALTGSAPITTAIAAGVGLVQIGWEKTHGRPVAPLQYLSIALVLIFGGASYYTNDPRIIMYKPSLIYCAVAIAMMQKGWLDRYVPARVHDNAPQFGDRRQRLCLGGDDAGGGGGQSRGRGRLRPHHLGALQYGGAAGGEIRQFRTAISAFPHDRQVAAARPALENA